MSDSDSLKSSYAYRSQTVNTFVREDIMLYNLKFGVGTLHTASKAINCE